jgi:predicted amidohydrolase
MTAPFKAACVQVSAGREIAPNVETALRLGRAAAARGARFIAFPENATMIEPVAAAAMRKALSERDHPALPAFAGLARETGAWVLGGSLSIRRDPGHRDGGKYANRSFLFDPAGTIAARYDKLHLFDVDLPTGERHRESERIVPGSEAVTAATPWGVVGLTICYDVRFPQLYRALARAGAFLFTVPSAFTVPTGRAHWHVLNRARAIECGAYVLAPAQCGTHAEGRRTFGHSLIVDPWGEVLAEAGEEEGVIVAEIDPAKSADARRRIPALQHDRPFAEPATADSAKEAAE